MIGSILGFIVGWTIQLPKVLWICVTFPFKLASAKHRGRKHGEALADLHIAALKQKHKRN